MSGGEAAVTVFGEVLYDRFPDGESVMGGAPFNVAWNLQALGLPPILVSRIGVDDLGRRIVTAMQGWGMDTIGLQRDRRQPTGTVEVTLEDGEPRFEIAAAAAYDFIDADTIPPAAPDTVLYHGSLALRTPVPRLAVKHLRELAGGGTLVDVNLRAPWWERGDVLTLLHGARWAKLNEDELTKLVPREKDRERRAAHLLAEAGLECLVITLGADGAVVHGRDGTVHEVAPPPRGPVKDTVGAGDAFSGMMLAGLTQGEAAEAVLDRAVAFASASCGWRGALPADPAVYARWRTPPVHADIEGATP